MRLSAVQEIQKSVPSHQLRERLGENPVQLATANKTNQFTAMFFAGAIGFLIGGPILAIVAVIAVIAICSTECARSPGSYHKHLPTGTSPRGGAIPWQRPRFSWFPMPTSTPPGYFPAGRGSSASHRPIPPTAPHVPVGRGHHSRIPTPPGHVPVGRGGSQVPPGHVPVGRGRQGQTPPGHVPVGEGRR